MISAHDIYAETNPAYGATVLASFIAAFVSLQEAGPELPVCHIVLPVVLSGELAATFDGTNKNTGLLEWLTRNPQIQIGLAARINACADIVTKSVQFGCFAQVLTLTLDGRLRLGTQKIKKSALRKLHNESVLAIRYAERFGYWLASAGSTRTVFNMMGITA